MAAQETPFSMDSHFVQFLEMAANHLNVDQPQKTSRDKIVPHSERPQAQDKEMAAQ